MLQQEHLKSQQAIGDSSRRAMHHLVHSTVSKADSTQIEPVWIDLLVDQIFRRASLADAGDPAQCAGYEGSFGNPVFASAKISQTVVCDSSTLCVDGSIAPNAALLSWNPWFHELCARQAINSYCCWEFLQQEKCQQANSTFGWIDLLVDSPPLRVGGSFENPVFARGRKSQGLLSLNSRNGTAHSSPCEAGGIEKPRGTFRAMLQQQHSILRRCDEPHTAQLCGDLLERPTPS